MGEVVVEAEEEMVPMVGSFFCSFRARKREREWNVFFFFLVMLVISVTCFFLLPVFGAPLSEMSPTEWFVWWEDGVCEIED